MSSDPFLLIPKTVIGIWRHFWLSQWPPVGGSKFLLAPTGYGGKDAATSHNAQDSSEERIQSKT